MGANKERKETTENRKEKKRSKMFEMWLVDCELLHPPDEAREFVKGDGVGKAGCRVKDGEHTCRGDT